MATAARERRSLDPLLEAAPAAVVAVVAVIGNVMLDPHRGANPIGAGLLAAAGAALVLRRARPRATVAFTIVVAFVYSLLDFPGGLYTLPAGIALYSAVDAGHRRAAYVAAAGGVVGLLAIGMLFGRGHLVTIANATWFGGWLVASLVLGDVTRGRRLYLEQIEQRAIEAERTREEEALRRAGEERLRIARELHDILAHRISSISVQSGVGLHLLDRDPEQARQSLVAINEASREALQELRATLGLLRHVDEPEPRAPTPGLAQLGDVVGSAAAAGVAVSVDVHGERRVLPSTVDAAAYRIVQESLTNVVRHARATRARVDLTYDLDAVEVEVEDDGRGVTDGDGSPAGHGLLGMRERAGSLGGRFEAGGRPGGGFRVWARLPIRTAS